MNSEQTADAPREPLLSSEEEAALRAPVAPADDNGPAPAGRIVDLHADHWERISGDRPPALESIGERLASLLKLTGRRYFRQAVEIGTRVPRTERWGSYVRRLPVPASLNVLEIRNSGNAAATKGVICLDPELVFVLVDIFFGGDGKASRPAAQSEFTPMETRLVRKFVTSVVQDLKDAWRPFVDMDLQLGKTEVNPIFAGVAAASEAMTVTTIDITVAGRELNLDVVLPASLVEPIRFLRDSGVGSKPGNDPQRWQTRIKEEMEDARVNLRAVLGRAEISLRDITLARPGDVIPMDIPSTVILYAGDTPLLEGTFGAHQGRNAVRITKPANRTTVGEKYGSGE
jgi:flagellar motor switch protein FliM